MDSPLLIGLLVFAVVIAGAFAGWAVRQCLPSHHLTDDTKNLVSVSMAVVATVSALVLGLLISNVTNSQQTAMLISMMGMMLPTLLFTGFMFPLENMPKIFQLISYIIPSRYYYIIIKDVMLKGLGFAYVWKETLILSGMAVFLLAVALKNFKIRLS